MKDLFLEFDSCYQSFKGKKDLYNKMYLFQFDILEDSYKNILMLQQGVDAFSIDYMDFRDYTLMVGNEHKNLVKNFMQYLEQLKKEADTEFVCYNNKIEVVLLSSAISFSELLELLAIFNIKCVNFSVLDDEGVIRLTVLENDEYIVYEFPKKISMALVEDGEIRFNSILEYLLGLDFIMFYINYKYNNPNCDISDICREYKNTCLNR